MRQLLAGCVIAQLGQVLPRYPSLPPLGLSIPTTSRNNQFKSIIRQGLGASQHTLKRLFLHTRSVRQGVRRVHLLDFLDILLEEGIYQLCGVVKCQNIRARICVNSHSSAVLKEQRYILSGFSLPTVSDQSTILCGLSACGLVFGVCSCSVMVSP